MKKQLLALGITLSALLSFSCQNNGNNNRNNMANTPQMWNQWGWGAGQWGNPMMGQMTPLLSNVYGETMDGMRVQLQILGTVMGGCAQPANRLIFCAMGPAILQGTLEIFQTNLFCGAPVGVYQLQPMQPSQIANATITGGMYMATNGMVQIQLQVMQGILYNPQSLDAWGWNRIGLTAQMFVNGRPCGTVSFY